MVRQMNIILKDGTDKVFDLVTHLETKIDPGANWRSQLNVTFIGDIIDGKRILMTESITCRNIKCIVW